MKIAVLSDCRMPTRREGGHGLGRLAWDLAAGLAVKHTVTLFAGLSSDTLDGVQMRFHGDEADRARQLAADHVYLDQDVMVDLSHQHVLSKLLDADRPVINWVADLECDYQPPCAVVGNAWQQKALPSARIVPLGIDVDRIPPFTGKKEYYLAYAAKIELRKGYDIALDVHCRQAVPVRFVGERFVQDDLPWWKPELTGVAFWQFLGEAKGLLSPCRLDAGGRVNLEAAACGTPVLCLEGTGTSEHVEHCLSGFICHDTAEMADAVGDLACLSGYKMRRWVQETHDLRRMVEGVERLAQAVADGERW